MRVSDDALDLVFRRARTYNAWLPKPVPEELLRQLYDTVKWGPTSANIGPARFVFIRSTAGWLSVLRATKSWSRSRTSWLAWPGLCCPAAKSMLDGRGKDAALGKHRTLSTFPPPRRRRLLKVPPRSAEGEKETKEQYNDVPENLNAQMRP